MKWNGFANDCRRGISGQPHEILFFTYQSGYLEHGLGMFDDLLVGEPVDQRELQQRSKYHDHTSTDPHIDGLWSSKWILCMHCASSEMHPPSLNTGIDTVNVGNTQ